MKVKIKSRDEFDALVVIVRLVYSRIIASGEMHACASVQGWCRLRSLDKLLVRLMLIAVRWGQFQKTVRVELDEMQMATLYEMLQRCPFPLYELQLANRIISEIERNYGNEKGRINRLRSNNIEL